MSSEHEHTLEFVKEENGVSQWKCVKPYTKYISHNQPVYFGLCGYVELQAEDSQP